MGTEVVTSLAGPRWSQKTAGPLWPRPGKKTAVAHEGRDEAQLNGWRGWAAGHLEGRSHCLWTCCSSNLGLGTPNPDSQDPVPLWSPRV